MTEFVNILSLDSAEVTEFMLQKDQYCSTELPIYFDFTTILQFVAQTIGDKAYEDCLSDQDPGNCRGVNLDMLINKDGRYAIRPLVIPNPYLYYFLVRELFSPIGWENLRRHFEEYCKVPNIHSCALPVIPKPEEEFRNSTVILNWWNSIEQESLRLSLEYRYMFVTDITNCYGCINTESVVWALTYQNTSKTNEGNRPWAKQVQKYLQAFMGKHNIGIPQGSTLFDVVAEIILSYADLLLYERIHQALPDLPENSYRVIRYRDDYRIFCDRKDILEKISYLLQEVLEGLNFRLNSQKTKISNSIVMDAIKPDKLFYIYNNANSI